MRDLGFAQTVVEQHVRVAALDEHVRLQALGPVEVRARWLPHCASAPADSAIDESGRKRLERVPPAHAAVLDPLGLIECLVALIIPTPRFNLLLRGVRSALEVSRRSCSRPRAEEGLA